MAKMSIVGLCLMVTLAIIGITILQQPIEPMTSNIGLNSNLGINFAWLNNHDGSEITNWLNIKYDPAKVNADLDGIQNTGIRKVRAFLQIDSVMSCNGTSFVWNEQSRSNLNDFVKKCKLRGIHLIVVMDTGNSEGNTYTNLDGKFKWPLIKTQQGIDKYLVAQTMYINELKSYNNILMFEIMSEPYAELTWSLDAKASDVTKDDVHNYLKQSYNNAKRLTNVPVGFSDYEEEEQGKYRTFSDDANREKYIDDCTDIYSMHIYRPDASYLYDFSKLTSKPKWLSEFGNLNYEDLDIAKSYRKLVGHNELYDTEKNFNAVISIAPKAESDGFSGMYLWSWSSNIGMVSHNPDGTHTVKKLLLWVKSQISR